jgi:hypothetical protein
MNFVLGKYLGALILALLIGLGGMLGALIGTFMPWLDQARIEPFSLLPWTYIFFVVILPNTLVLCALFFSVAALTRSFALTYGAAMIFFVADLLLNGYARLEAGSWAALADPVARLTEAPLDSWFGVAVFSRTGESLEGVAPLYIEEHRLHSGKHVLTVRTSTRPGMVARDPFHKRIDRNEGNNNLLIPAPLPKSTPVP